MTGLVEFLLARLDEDEAAAQAADGGPWGVTEGPGYSHEEWRIVGRDTTTARYDPVAKAHVTVPTRVEVAGPGYEGGGVWTRANAEHIAHHDPDRVLREVEAKRRIVDLHRWDRGHRGDGKPVCVACRFDRVWPCLVVRLLALVDADHPDYRAEWAP